MPTYRCDVSNKVVVVCVNRCSGENVRGTESELLKYYNMAQGNRSLILKIFFILLLMIFLFVVVF